MAGQVTFRNANQKPYIIDLYYLAKKTNDTERVASWVEKNLSKYSSDQIKVTLKMAGMDELADYFVSEVDIKIGDTIKSRSTARVGRVTGIHKDGDTIEVMWDAGGRQIIAKESVFKLLSSDIQTTDDIAKVTSMATYDSYGDIKK
jgi:hypothetical protein